MRGKGSGDDFCQGGLNRRGGKAPHIEKKNQSVTNQVSALRARGEEENSKSTKHFGNGGRGWGFSRNIWYLKRSA